MPYRRGPHTHGTGTRAPMRARVATCVVIMATCVAMAMGTDAMAYSAPVCHEDDPCWTWSTMGNLKRGVTMRDGTLRVVGPCAFKRADARGRIDWTRTSRMRGDHTARVKRC